MRREGRLHLDAPVYLRDAEYDHAGPGAHPVDALVHLVVAVAQQDLVAHGRHHLLLNLDLARVCNREKDRTNGLGNVESG